MALINAKTGRISWQCEGKELHQIGVGGGKLVSFSTDDERLLYSTYQVKVWPTTNREYHEMTTFEYSVRDGHLKHVRRGFEYSCDGRFLIQRREKEIEIFSATDSKFLGRIESHPADVWPEHLDFSPDGKYVVASRPFFGSTDVNAQIWDFRHHKVICGLIDPRSTNGHLFDAFWGAAWSQDGKLVATAGEDPYYVAPQGSFTEAMYAHRIPLKIWDAKTGKLKLSWPEIFVSFETPRILMFLSREHLLANGQIYNVATSLFAFPSPIRDGKFLVSLPRAVAVSPDRKYLAIGDQSIKIISLTNGKTRTLVEAARSKGHVVLLPHWQPTQGEECYAMKPTK
jgi:WD40 repeat protein